MTVFSTPSRHRHRLTSRTPLSCAPGSCSSTAQKPRQETACDLVQPRSDTHRYVRRAFFRDLVDLAVDLGPLIGATAFGPDSSVRAALVERLDALFDVATAITVNGIPDLMKDDVDVRLAMEKLFGALWFAAEMARWTDRPYDREAVLDQMILTIFEGLLKHPGEEQPARA